MEESLDVISFEANKKQLELICDTDPNLTEFLIGDAARVRQILVNLLNNAVKFSNKPNSEITVIVSSRDLEDQQNCEICCSVKDEGVGVSSQAKEKLFQPFSQADSSVTRRYGGTGLGLSICAQLTKLMGGKIWLESQEGFGSCVHFTLSVQKDKEKKSLQQSTHSKEQQKILIVDQSRNLLRVLSSKLKSWGFNVFGFTSCKEAFVEPQNFDIFLIDSKQISEFLNVTGNEHTSKFGNLFVMSPTLNSPVLECGGTCIRKPIRNEELKSKSSSSRVELRKYFCVSQNKTNT